MEKSSKILILRRWIRVSLNTLAVLIPSVSSALSWTSCNNTVVASCDYYSLNPEMEFQHFFTGPSSLPDPARFQARGPCITLQFDVSRAVTHVARIVAGVAGAHYFQSFLFAEDSASRLSSYSLRQPRTALEGFNNA
jgi:hypothetical protein